MAEFILSEKQLKLINNNINFNINLESAQENWLKLSTKEKEFVIEMAKLLYPHNSVLLKEAKWYNTLGDIIGIFDPTGVVDLVNGISYIKQGDNLFGFLSIVSAVPYVGDVVAKPVMGALKIGGPSTKALKGILELVKAGRPIEDAAKELVNISKRSGMVRTFVKGMQKIGPKLRPIVEKLPGGVVKGFKNTILGWISLFEKAAAGGTAIRVTGMKLARKMPKMSQEEVKAAMNELIKVNKKTGLFRSYTKQGKISSLKDIYTRIAQFIGRHRSVRVLIRKTKFWAGFLDWMGIGNFVGPDELIKEMGEDNFQKSMEEYQKTSEAQQYYYDDFGNEMPPNNQTSSSQSTQKTNTSPIQSFVSSLFTGQV